VLQCVAVCCSVLQGGIKLAHYSRNSIAVHVAMYVAVCCSVLQCVAVCCSVLQCVAVWEVLSRHTVQFSIYNENSDDFSEFLWAGSRATSEIEYFSIFYIQSKYR